MSHDVTFQPEMMDSINKARNDVEAGVAAKVSDVTYWLYPLATKRAFRMDSPDVPGRSGGQSNLQTVSDPTQRGESQTNTTRNRVDSQ